MQLEECGTSWARRSRVLVRLVQVILRVIASVPQRPGMGGLMSIPAVPVDGRGAKIPQVALPGTATYEVTVAEVGPPAGPFPLPASDKRAAEPGRGAKPGRGRQRYQAIIARKHEEGDAESMSAAPTAAKESRARENRRGSRPLRTADRYFRVRPAVEKSSGDGGRRKQTAGLGDRPKRHGAMRSQKFLPPLSLTFFILHL